MAPIGTWPKNQVLKELGSLNLVQVLNGLEGFSLRMFCDALGRTKEEVLAQLEEVRRELCSNTIHCMFDM